MQTQTRKGPFPMNTFIDGPPTKRTADVTSEFLMATMRRSDVPILVLDVTGQLIRSMDSITKRMGWRIITDIAGANPARVTFDAFPRSANMDHLLNPVPEHNLRLRMEAQAVLWALRVTGAGILGLQAVLSNDTSLVELFRIAALADPQGSPFHQHTSELIRHRAAILNAFRPCLTYVVPHIARVGAQATTFGPSGAGSVVMLDLSVVPEDVRSYVLFALDAFARVRSIGHHPSSGFDVYKSGPVVATVLHDPHGFYVQRFYKSYYHSHSEGHVNVFVSSCESTPDTSPESMRSCLAACSHDHITVRSNTVEKRLYG